MSGSTIRSIASNDARADIVRGVHRLSDGSLVAVIIDGNRNDITGDGGDGTNVGKIYIYSAPDPGTTWTLRATLTTDLVGTTDTLFCSSAVDASDNVHVAYITHALNVVYVLGTHGAGPTYSFGTPTTLFTAVTAEKAYAVDIDTMGSSGTVACVAVETVNTTSNLNTLYTYTGSVTTWIISGTNIAQSSGGDVTMASSIAYPRVSICAAKDTIVSNVGTYVVAWQTTSAAAGPFTEIRSVQLNVSTGVIAHNTSIKTMGIVNPFQIFNTNGARTFLFGGLGNITVVNTGTRAGLYYWQFTMDSTGVTATDVVSFGAIADINNQLLTTVKRTAGFSWNGSSLLATYIIPSGTQTVLTNILLGLSGGVAKSKIPFGTWDSAKADYFWHATGGNNRNFGATHLDIMTWEDGTLPNGLLTLGTNAYFNKLHLPLAPSAVVPASGATISTDRPIITANFENDFDNVQVAEKMVWQLATDAGFTLNVKTLTDPDSVFSLPLNTGPSNATVTESNVIDSINELFQTTWFIRAAEIDILGNQGAYSAAHSFTVTHPPTATGLSPNGGQIIVYGTGSVTFSWTFSDPSPFDFQTAYEILVTKVSDGSTVVDSGIISSGSSSGAVSIPSADKNIPLQWQVRVYDSDNVTKGYTTAQPFSVADAPTPAITSPTNGGTITSGVPVVNWTSGVSGGATEASWRLVVSLAGVSVYDTGTVAGTALTTNVPPGFLHTAHNYTFTLTVNDSKGLSGQSIISVTSAWTPPTAGDIKVFTYEYARKGFVFVGWTNVNIDSTHFTMWNVYRKGVNDTSWTLLDTLSDFRDSYGYRDYSAPALTTLQYIVTQVIVASTGDIVESAFTTFTTVTTPSAGYWILDPLGVQDAVAVYGVNADSFTDEYEIAEFVVVGRGRHVDIGSYLGANGTLVAAMRDKALGVPTEINYLLNPGFQSHAVGVTPDNWTITGGGTFGAISTDYYNFYEPAPNGALTNCVVRVASLTSGIGTNFIRMAQVVPLARLPFTTTGQTFSLSFWEALEPDLTDVQLNAYNIGVEFRNAADAVLSTDEATATVVDHYEPTGTEPNCGNWFRLARTITVPAGAIDHIVIYLKVGTTSSSVHPELFQGGAQLEAGSVSQYFDGDMPGGSWTNGQYVSSSQGGLYTARQQRLDIAAMAALDRPVYLRNPFGDIIYCSLQTDSTPSGSQLAREAGYGGGVDYGQLTIPYLAVGF